MKDNKDDFWKELMGENPEEPKDKKEKQDGQEPKSGDLGFIIEYLNSDGDVLGSSTSLDGQKSSDDDFWVQFERKESQKPDGQTGRPGAAPGASGTGHTAPGANGGAARVNNTGRPSGSTGHTNNAGKSGDSVGKTPDASGSAGNTARPRQETGAPVPPTRRSQPESFDERMGPKDFEVDFDFDREYEDVNEKPIKRGRSKRTGCLSGILYFVFILCISVVLACLGWMAATDVLGLGAEDSTVEVTITKDMFSSQETEIENEDGSVTTTMVDVADIGAVADVLREQGLIKYKWLFKLYSSFSHADTKIKTGTYELNLNYDYRAIVNGMTAVGGKKVEIDITIPEGYSITQIVNLLVENNVCDKVELMDALANYDFDYDFLDESTIGQEKRLEGYLFPDTYTFYVGDTATRVINKMLVNFDNKWTDEMQAQADALGYTQREILTIASMIEKEAGAGSERATIASVIYNRLKNPGTQGTVGLLQIDATIYYAIADTGETFSTDIDSPYNTYKYEGLTPGPIANPGLASIQAALEPESTSYYYYALGKDGTHEFFKTYEGFQEFINSDEYGG